MGAAAPDKVQEHAAAVCPSESEERYRTIIQTAHEGIWLIDRAACTLLVNQRMADLLGFSVEAMHGRPVADFVFPENLAGLREHIASNLAGKAEQFDFCFRRRDGGGVHVLAVTSAVRDKDGGVVGALGMFSDLTERKRLETERERLNEMLEARVAQRTRALQESNRRLLAEIEERRQADAAARRERWFSDLVIESARDGIAAIDTDMRHTVWNAALETMTGLSRAQVLGRTVREVFAEIAGSSIARAWRAALAGRGSAVQDRRYAIAKTGRSGMYEGNFAPLLGPDGAIIGAIAFLRDTTERRRLEETLRQSQKLEAIGQLTGGIAHDFNNLLSAIIGNLELIGERTRSPQIAAYVKSASRAADRGARLTQELLAFSRKQRLAAKPVDLNALIAGMGDLMSRSIGVMVRIEHRLGRDLWRVMVDPTQFELAILNLAINARDAMPEGGVLTIATANVATDDPGRPRHLPRGNHVALSVSDSGVGMSAEVRARAFEPFFTTKESGKGTGLGLSMVYGVVTQSGGTVDLDSVPGQGTTVRLYLPQGPAAVRAPDGGPEVEQKRAAPGGRSTILLVDDDADMRDIATTFLTAQGYCVIEAESGRCALTILEREPVIDLLVVDYAMPGMTGADLAASASAARPGLRVLFTTGYANTAALDDANRADLVLRKPFRLRDLATRIERALGDTAAAADLRSLATAARI